MKWNSLENQNENRCYISSKEEETVYKNLFYMCIELAITRNQQREWSILGLHTIRFIFLIGAEDLLADA